jgi:hypothetical protein
MPDKKSAERTIRLIAIDWKNWLFGGSKGGGKSLATRSTGLMSC